VKNDIIGQNSEQSGLIASLYGSVHAFYRLAIAARHVVRALTQRFI
jgi:hypothetical protein